MCEKLFPGGGVPRDFVLPSQISFSGLNKVGVGVITTPGEGLVGEGEKTLLPALLASTPAAEAA